MRTRGKKDTHIIQHSTTIIQLPLLPAQTHITMAEQDKTIMVTLEELQALRVEVSQSDYGDGWDGLEQEKSDDGAYIPWSSIEQLFESKAAH